METMETRLRRIRPWKRIKAEVASGAPRSSTSDQSMIPNFLTDQDIGSWISLFPQGLHVSHNALVVSRMSSLLEPRWPVSGLLAYAPSSM